MDKKACQILPRTIPAFVVTALIAMLVGCTPTAQQDEAMRSAVDDVQARYAPDRRVTVFDITWERSSSGVVVKGEVDRPAAKEEVLKVLGKLSGLRVVDSIRVLPGERLARRPYGLIAVSVGNMRSKPRESAEMVTQVLMGMVVKLMKKRGGWYYVQSYDQYLGWIEGDAMKTISDKQLEDWRSARRLITTATVGFIKARPAPDALPVSDIVVGCTFKEVGRRGGWYSVELPDGRTGYVEASQAEEFSHWKQQRDLTADNVERSASTFMGIPYLWGGTSAKGFDCSGFTKTVYRMNGLELSRDANQQAQQGMEVPGSTDWNNLRKGDLIFFGRAATDSSRERISHVGIYLAKGEYIHCSGRVRLNSLDPSAPDFDEYNHRRYVRARRVIGTSSVPEVQ